MSKTSDALDLADLPAPRRPSALGGESAKPAPRSGLAAAGPTADLPAPRTRKPPAGALELDDLLGEAGADLVAPRAPGHVDLPAPRAGQVAHRPAAGGGALTDLPAPKPRSAPIADLPAPRAKTPPPVPKIPSLKPPAMAGALDLPGPKAARPGVVDLPAPKSSPGIVDLPTPKAGITDLPMPKAGGVGDLPAPKGFFDDLPQPARTSTQPPSTDIAPKGFFDDLPQRAHSSSQHPTDDIAPKGFFDDLPQRAQNKPSTDVAPLGFFDDLPQRAKNPSSTDVAPKGFFDDLPMPAIHHHEQPAGPGSGHGALELDIEAPDANLELQVPTPERLPGPSNQFDDLDLSSPSPVSFAAKKAQTAAAANVATISASAAASATAAARSPLAPLGKGGEGTLELEEPRQGGGIATVSQRLGPQERADALRREAADKRARRGRTRKIIMITLLGLVVLGGVGFVFYRRHAKQAEQQAAISDQLASARRALGAAQWSRAQIAASETLAMDKTNAEALGIGAEASFALGLAEGNPAVRFAKGRKLLADAIDASVKHPALERAQALSAVAGGQGDKAVERLKPLIAKAPKDGSLALYLGWAQVARGDVEAALAAFAEATASPAVKLHALLARARLKQGNGDLEGARADYAAVIEIQKDHLGAQVGLASALPASQSQQQEADLLAILAIKDVEKKQPAAAAQAWVLAAEAARRGGRLDVARERFRNALKLSAADVAALTGLAEVELRDGKVDLAAETITKALTLAPDDMRAQLVATEISIEQKVFDDAAKRLAVLAKRTPPPPIVDQAHLKMLEAQLLSAQGKPDEAITLYVTAAKLAGELDLALTLGVASKLTVLADKADDPERADELRRQADELLGALADNARKDPRLAITLGIAYLQANLPVKAEGWMRAALTSLPKDVDAHYQLAKALAMQGRLAESLEGLRTAIDLDPSRSDIGLELARAYEEGKRDDDAGQLYEKLLGAKEPQLVLRVRAGRFYARTGQFEKAAVEGKKILEVQDDHPAGLYLKGEGLLREGKTELARKALVAASDADPEEPQYQDARGRASEQWAKESANTAYQDDALRAYGLAVKADPRIFTSWLGQGRLYVARGEDKKALMPLQAAWNLQKTQNQGPHAAAEVARLTGLAAKALDDPKSAARWLEESIRFESNADASYHLGQLYTTETLNNPRAAIGAFARAVQLAEGIEKEQGTTVPWLTEALYSLGDINRSQNNLKEAKRAWEKYVQRPQKPSTRLTEVKGHLATSLRDQ